MLRGAGTGSAPSHLLMRRRSLLLQAAGLTLAACAKAPQSGVRPRRAAPLSEQLPALALPRRPAGALGATALVDELVKLRPGEREARLTDEYLAGNIPDFLRTFVPVQLAHGGLEATCFVLSDYLAVGEAQDWVRAPLTIRGARTDAKAAQCVLPTTRVVDAIHAAAKVRIASPYMPPGRDMSGVDYFVRHHRTIEQRREAQPLGVLISGHKKDLVISKRELSSPSRTPIYGWFRDDGTPIQPLSLLHDQRYVDYAHGIRLVHGRIRVDGAWVDFIDALADAKLAPLVSDEGRFSYALSWARGY